MSVTATVAAPARAPRKQLSDQLDRLEGILDVLAEALPGAVAEACREGARHAVRGAVVELLTSPEFLTLLDALRAGTAPPGAAPERGPGPWARLKAKTAAVRTQIVSTATRAKEALLSRFRSLGGAVSALSALTGEPLPWRQILGAGIGFGLTVGVLCLIAPHGVAAAVAGIGAGATGIAVRTAHWLRAGARRLGLI